MEIVLLAITVLSLIALFIVSVSGWRLAREERARSAARIAALAAAADDEPDVTAIDTLHQSQQRPSVPRDAPLWSEPHLVRPAQAVAPPWAPARVSSPLGDSFLGSSVAQPPNAGQRGLAMAAGVLLLALVGAGYFMVFGGDTPGASAASSAGTETPLELVSLRHERQSDGLAITGLVRNPVSGTAVDKLSAVVFLFDQQGTLVTSARSAVDFTQLGPGDESPFVITLDAPSSVARYRVSFRNDAGVVRHIDRRGQEPIARETP